VHKEYEVKILNIDPATIEQKLQSIGAVKEGDYLYRSCSFDYPDFPLNKNNSWVRLRDEGNKTMLAYKRRLGVTSNAGNDEGMEEIEVEVSDFEKTKQFLLKIGMIIKFEQEKKRTRFVKDDIEFDIDTWPRLQPYMEIEGKSDEAVYAAMALLGIDRTDALKCSMSQVYEMNGIKDMEYTKMTFDEFVKRSEN